MRLFDLFKRPRTPEQGALEEMKQLLHARVFRGGDAELVFRAQKTLELSNGKLDLISAARVYSRAAIRIWLASTEFDGEKHLGIKGLDLLQRTIEDSENKLSTFEAAAIISYSLFDKIDPTQDACAAVKQWADASFGTDEWGVDSDEIPQGIGEFGYEPTNPIPVRGIYANVIYLDRLRTTDGGQISRNRLRSLDSPNIQGKIDEYEISQGGKVLCKLYVSPYNRKISDRPPSGFLLVKRDST